jgi:hypothetical protein
MSAVRFTASLINWIAVCVGATLLIVACGGDTTPSALADEPDRTPLEQVQSDCVIPATALGDDGHTLVIDHKGEDDTSGVSFETVACVLAALDTPTSITARMSSTRALDGVQSGSWDGYSAVWSYHPDNGMDLIIEED